MALFKRGEIWWFDIQIDGKRHRGSTMRTSRKEALLVEAEERKKLLDFKQFGTLPPIALKEGVEYWFAKWATKLDDRERIRRLIDVMFEGPKEEGPQRKLRQWTWPKDKQLHTLTNADLKRWVNTRLGEGLSAASIKAEMNVIRRTVSRLEGLHATPKLTWPSPRDDKRLVTNAKSRFLDADERRALLDHLDPYRPRNNLPFERQPRPIQYDLLDAYDLCVMLLYTGARLGEILALPWDDVDLKSRRINLKRPKVKLWTGLKMSEKVHKLLSDRRERRLNSPWVFPERDSPDTHRKQCRAISRAMDELGFNAPLKVERYGGRATIHTLRDTFASVMAQSGQFTLQDIATMLGHSKTTMTEKYARLIPSKVADEVAGSIDELTLVA